MSDFEILRPTAGLGAPLLLRLRSGPPELVERLVSTTLDQGAVVLVAVPDRPGAEPDRRESEAGFESAEALALAELLERFGRCLIVEVRFGPATAAPGLATGLGPDRESLALEIDYDPDRTPESLVLALEQRLRSMPPRLQPEIRDDEERRARLRAVDEAWVGRLPDDVSCDERDRDPRVVTLCISVTVTGTGVSDEAGAEAGVGVGVGVEIERLVRTAMLFEAFRHTSFFAETPAGRIRIRVGAHCPEIDELSRRDGGGVRDGDGDGDGNATGDGGRDEDGLGGGDGSWAYVTAYNPHGQAAPEIENERAQARLLRELRDTKRRFHLGASQGDLGDWPPEPSVLILGIAEADAVRLAARFRQAALVVGRRGERARLLPAAVP